MKTITADKHVDRSNEYFCKKCAKRYKAEETQVDIENGRMIAWRCPNGHPVKLIGRTALPCPLCGHVYKDSWGEAKPFREEGRPCDSCMSQYERMKAALEALEKETATMEDRAIPDWVNMPSPTGHREVDLDACFLGVVRLMGMPSAERKRYDLETIPINKGDKPPAYCVRKYTPEQIMAVQKLYEAILEVCRLEREEGRERGESFIQRMAAGEISIQELNQHTLNNYRLDKVKRILEIATRGKRMKERNRRELESEINSALSR